MDNRIVDYRSAQPPTKPRTRWWLLIVILAIAPLVLLAASFGILAYYRIGPGD